ncbi:MAG: major facilitator transporter [Bacteroidetes bacterium]|nr:major facilitator transporter [Bacteroidota bacterium]
MSTTFSHETIPAVNRLTGSSRDRPRFFLDMPGIRLSDSSVYSTGLTELVPPEYLGAAYALRSVLGFGAGVVSPWVFGLAIDWARGEPLRSETMAWGLAWSSLGVGALLGPIMTLKLRALPEARSMAGGRR